MGLGGRTILITRSREQSSEFARSIELHGGQPVVFPAISIEDPESWKECDEAIRNLRTYTDLIFTSTNAVDRFFNRCTVLGVDLTEFAHISVHSVGVKTAAAVEARGLTGRNFPETFSSEQLANLISSETLKGRSFLLPQGNIAKQDLTGVLRQSGASVDTVVVYRTVDAERQNVSQLLEMLRNGKIDVVTFASPSAANNFFRAIPPEEVSRSPRPPRIAVIGPATAEAVVGLGIGVDISAKESTVAGLVSAIAEFYES